VTESRFDGIDDVLCLSSGRRESSECRLCDERFDGSLECEMNHYLQFHRYRILHVGTEADQTVVMLGAAKQHAVHRWAKEAKEAEARGEVKSVFDFPREPTKKQVSQS
jgi:hypothetical protein